MRNERGGQSEIPYPENLLKVIENYKSGPPTPETVTAYWKAKMDFEGRKARRDIRVSQCTWNEREIQSPMFDIHGNPIEGMMVYVGKKFTKEDGYSFLGKIFPKLSSVVTPPYYYQDTIPNSGWVKVEATISSPNLGTNEEEIAKIQAEYGYQGQRLITYILASYASKDLIGQHFDHSSRPVDEWTRSRLAGSLTNEGLICIADMYSEGSVHTNPRTTPDNRNPHRGARFEQTSPSLSGVI